MEKYNGFVLHLGFFLKCVKETLKKVTVNF